MPSLKEAYSAFKNDYALYVLPIALAGVLYVLTVPLGFIYLIVGASYAAIIAPSIIKKINYSDDEDKAWSYLKQKWHQKTGESLSIRNGRSLSRYFGKSLFYAFVVNRGDIGDKKYLPFIGVVQLEPLRIAGWEDHPSDQIIDNPFIAISPVFIGSPSANMTSELEPSLRSGFQDKKPKEKKEQDSEKQSDDLVINE